VAFLATEQFAGLGLADGVSPGQQFMVQLAGVLITALWTGLFSYLILKLITLLVPLRVDRQTEIEGLDLAQHGERGYHGN